MNDIEEETTLTDTPRDDSIIMNSNYDEEQVSLARKQESPDNS